MHSRTMTAALTVAVSLSPLATMAQDGPFAVTTDTISHELTTDIHVWAPVGEGPFPFILALHGTGVDYGADWDVVGTRLAQNGVVTFAPDYHASDWQTGDFTRVIRESECAYRYVREVAHEFGADPGQPVVMLGHSIGGTYVLGGGLDVERFGPEGDYAECFTGAPRPDLVVSIAGCHFEAYGMTFEVEPAVYGAGDATLLFIGAEHDETCPAWQSVDAAEVFTADGYSASSVVVPDATHLSIVGHEVIDDEYVTLADDPAATALAQAVLAAIEAAR